MLQHHRKLLAGVSGNSVGGKGVLFDGSTYIARGGGLTGATNFTAGIVSFWIKPSGNNEDVYSDDIDTSASNIIKVSSSGDLQILLFNSAASPNLVMAITTSGAPLNNGQWNHIIASWGVSASNVMYINDTLATNTSSYTANGVDWTRPNHYIGKANLGNYNAAFTGELAEFFLDIGTKYDLTLTERRKFIDADGLPADLGDNGELPLSGSPIMYHAVKAGETAADFATNKGTGGGFTTTGALLNATSPVVL